MPRKTHKRQRKQNGGNGGMYLSLKINKLREIADKLDNPSFKITDYDLTKLHITAEGFKEYKKKIVDFATEQDARYMILKQLTDYIKVLSQIIFGDAGPTRIIPEGKFPSTTQVTQRGLPLPNWFINFIDTYNLAISLYLEENQREPKEDLVGMTIDQFQEGDAQAGVSVSSNEAPIAEDERLDAERLANAKQQILFNRKNKIPGSVLGGRFVSKRKQKSNKHRRKSNRR